MVRVEFLRKMRFHSYVDAGMFFTVAQFYTQKINLNWYRYTTKNVMVILCGHDSSHIQEMTLLL